MKNETNNRQTEGRKGKAPRRREDARQREERLRRVIERGRQRADNVVEMFPEDKPRLVAAPDDLIMYGSMALALLSWAAVIVRVARSDGPLLETRGPEESPHDLWSFLGSRSGRTLIDGAFRTVQSYLDKR